MPARSVPPTFELPDTEMVNEAGELGPNGAATDTTNAHGAPFSVHEPANVAVLPTIANEENDMLLT